MSRADAPSFHIRLTPDLRKRIRLAAANNERSMTEEMLARLERSFSPDDENRMEAARLLTVAAAILDKGHTG